MGLLFALSRWSDRIKITVAYKEYEQPITTLTGTIDQAALQGLLRHLYSLGVLLISVICVDFMETRKTMM